MSIPLCLHTGARKCSLKEVQACKTPKATDTWSPIPHGLLVKLVSDALTTNGYKIIDEAHTLHHDNDRYFGILQVRMNKAAKTGKEGDYGMLVGLRNSHDRRLSAGIACGSRVFVCDNLAFSGELVLARRHTANAHPDLPAIAAKAVHELAALRKSQDERFRGYKDMPLDDPKDVNDLLIRSLRSEVIPSGDIGKVLKEWDAPSFAEFKEPTVWRLFNAFTWVLKGTNAVNIPDRTIRLHRLMDAYCATKCETATAV